MLAGCASGRPYVTTDAEAPSLGDAFIDAGAAMVVETAWRVQDVAAEPIMTDFNRRWAAAGIDPARALNDAVRGALHGANGVRHPFHWAAYSVVAGRLAPTPVLAAVAHRAPR